MIHRDKVTVTLFIESDSSAYGYPDGMPNIPYDELKRRITQLVEGRLTFTDDVCRGGPQGSVIRAVVDDVSPVEDMDKAA